MASKALSDVAADSVRALWERRKFSQRDLAKKIKRPPSVVNRIIKGTQPVTLRVLEAVSELTGISPVEMLIDPSVELKAVTPLESAMLRYFRGWPAPTREALITFASFFADEDPVTHDERRAHEQIRRLGDAKRRLVYGYLTFLTEGDLPRDVRIALGLPETDEPQSKTPPKRRTPKTPKA
jgi:transcriptional regulator with XRE-family HTH domain